LTAIPGGGTFFVSSDAEPSFGSYDFGGALTYKVSRLVSVEGELEVRSASHRIWRSAA
jgi:hypothetical protein